MSRKSLIGKLKTIYHDQVISSKKRKYSLPQYSEEEFINKFSEDPLYKKLYNSWRSSKFNKDLAPSFDRIDNYKTYSFDNIQLMTWKENRDNNYRDTINGINNKHSKAVIQFDKNMNHINEFNSQAEAERLTGVCNTGIRSCCKGRSKSAGGFIWKYKKN